jgi:hypothetical protein
MEYLRLVLQHREGIYWCPVPLRDEDQRSYKVRDTADVQGGAISSHRRVRLRLDSGERQRGFRLVT